MLSVSWYRLAYSKGTKFWIFILKKRDICTLKRSDDRANEIDVQRIGSWVIPTSNLWFFIPALEEETAIQRAGWPPPKPYYPRPASPESSKRIRVSLCCSITYVDSLARFKRRKRFVGRWMRPQKLLFKSRHPSFPWKEKTQLDDFCNGLVHRSFQLKGFTS